MTQRALTLALALATIGCSAAHPSDEVRTGIYELVAQAETDGCTPRRASGELGMVGVLVREGAVDAPVPAVGDALYTAPRVSLAPGASFHAETNRRIPNCDGAWVHEEWTMMQANGDRFELLHSQSWAGLQSCLGGVDAMRDAPEVDCDSERTLAYELQTVCDAPCSLHIDVSGEIICAC